VRAGALRRRVVEVGSRGLALGVGDEIQSHRFNWGMGAVILCGIYRLQRGLFFLKTIA
jgi:hypothetical protein